MKQRILVLGATVLATALLSVAPAHAAGNT